MTSLIADIVKQLDDSVASIINADTPEEEAQHKAAFTKLLSCTLAASEREQPGSQRAELGLRRAFGVGKREKQPPGLREPNPGGSGPGHGGNSLPVRTEGGEEDASGMAVQHGSEPVRADVPDPGGAIP